MLVAKGYHQEAGLDFEEMFSFIVRHARVKTILSLDVQFHWSLIQRDVMNAFLRGILKEVCMHQSPIFHDSAS